MRYLNLAFAFALVIAATQVQAAPAIDEAGAQTLKAHFDDTLAFELKISEVTGNGLTISGPVQVTPSGAYYQVKIPGVAFKFGEGAYTFNVGNVVSNVTPADDGSYLMSTAVPARMSIVDNKNGLQVLVKIGEQRSAAVWYPAYKNITKIDWSYKNISVNMPTAEPKVGWVSFEIGSIEAVRNLVKNADGTWSGPDSGRLKDIAITTGSNKLNFKIKEIVGNTVSDSLDLNAIMEIQKKAEEVMTQAANAATSTPDPAAFKAALSAILQDTTTMMNGFSSAFEISGIDLSFRDDATPETAGTAPVAPKTSSFKLDKAGFGLSIKDIRKEKGSVAYKIMMDGLSSSDIPAEIVSVVPVSFNIDVALDQLPMKKLSDTFMTAIKSSLEASMGARDAANAAAQQKSQQDMMMAVMTLPQILTDAGSSISVRNTKVTAPELVTTLDGSFTMKQGSMTLAFAGLDELIAKLQTQVSAQTASPKMGQMIQSLTMLQMSGQNKPGLDGKSIRTYTFDLTSDGRFLMNGADMSAMMGMMGMGARQGLDQAPQQPQQPTP